MHKEQSLRQSIFWAIKQNFDKSERSEIIQSDKKISEKFPNIWGLNNKQ